MGFEGLPGNRREFSPPVPVIQGRYRVVRGHGYILHSKSTMNGCAAVFFATCLNTQSTQPVLPGNFFYAGEQKQQWMFIVRKGKIAWSLVWFVGP